MPDHILDEHTPLLSVSQPTPAILSTISQIEHLPINEITTYHLFSQGFLKHSTRTAFSLIVFLQLRRTKLQPTYSNDDYEEWSLKKLYTREAELLEEQIINMWSRFLDEYRTAHEIETVLWTAYPEVQGGSKSLRVIDFLIDLESPAFLVSHPIILSSLVRTWKNGLDLDIIYPDHSNLGWFERHYDALCTPRASHFIELTSYMMFLALLIHYIINPYERPHTWGDGLEYFRLREFFLILFPLSFWIQHRPISSITLLITPLAFLISFPSVPFPGDISFTVLLWCLLFNILQLHLPLSPSPLFLAPHHFSLPLSIFLHRGFDRILYPCALFFFPMFLLFSFLLSFSLADTFLKIFTFQLHPWSLVANTPAPMDTRIGFLFFYAIMLILISSSAFVLATNPDSPTTNPWDRYSQPVGLAARKTFICAVLSNLGPRVPCPPMNILHILLIQIPHFGAHAFGARMPYKVAIEKTLWRITTGPLVVFFALLDTISHPSRYFRARRMRATSATTPS